MAVPPNGDIKVDTAQDKTADSGLETDLALGTAPRGLPRLTVNGFVDIATVDKFAQAIHNATGEHRVLLDLTRAQFVSTAGITVLFQHRSKFAAVLVSSNSIVDRALSAAGFPTIPTTHT